MHSAGDWNDCISIAISPCSERLVHGFLLILRLVRCLKRRGTLSSACRLLYAFVTAVIPSCPNPPAREKAHFAGSENLEAAQL